MPPVAEALQKSIEFEVRGQPVAKGSMKSFAVPLKRPRMSRNGRPITHIATTTHDSSRTKPWQDLIRTVAQLYTPSDAPWTGPVALWACFTLLKPKSAPKTRTVWAVKKPDADKLLRCVKDALKDVFYYDDAQVVEGHAFKDYGPAPGVRITLQRVTWSPTDAYRRHKRSGGSHAVQG